jgi:uncharacterized membrane protein
MNSKKFTLAIIIGALYVAMVQVFQPISFGPIQFRVANGLLGLVPFIGWVAVPTWLIAVMISNLTSPLGWLDLVTPFISAVLVALIVVVRRNDYAVFSAMVVYSIGVALWVSYELTVVYSIPFLITFVYVAVGNTAASAFLAFIIYRALKPIFKTYFVGYLDN